MNQWLKWISSLQGLAQNGMTFAANPFDEERYKAIQAISAEMLARMTNTMPAENLALFAQEIGYATPKLDVRAGVFKNNKILLVRERSDNAWTVPGGWADLSDTPTEAVEREVLEESGYLVKATKLIALLDKRKHQHPPSYYPTYKAFFLCKLEGGEPKENIEISEIDFFAKDKLPELSLPRITSEQIQMLFVHHAKPDLPAEFD
jgi:ADP-ribose pyrophosphatase YjhB (NUDIX family)